MNVLGRKSVIVGVIAVLVLLSMAQPAHAQGQVHVVQPGETLSSIAARYGTTAQAIARANGLSNPNYIYAGQRLTIPTGGGGGAVAAGGTYTVRPGDTLWSIAAQHGTTVNAIMQANGLANANYVYAGQRLIIPGGGNSSGSGSQAGGGTYVVRPGDTLASIAYRQGTTAWAIANANGLANPNYIYPGQRLRIPSGGGAAPAPASGGGSRIVVDLSDQRMYVYQNGQLLWNWVVSTGRPGQATVVGHFKVLNKIPNAYSGSNSFWTSKGIYLVLH